MQATAHAIEIVIEDALLARYLAHVDAAARASGARLRVWHIAAARGLYRLMIEREINGGALCPLGMPHALCMSDAEVCAL